MPTEIYRVLGQVQVDGVNTFNLYTVPANATAKVRVTVSSSDAGTHQFTISVSKNGAAIANGDRIYDSVDLLKNTSFTTAELTLDAGDIIRVKSNAGSGQSTFTFQAHGTEYYTPATGAYFDVIDGGVQSTVKLYNLEDNLTYVFYTDEDSLVRVGFKGYGPDNELAVNFPSSYERSNFITALENARVYGYGIDGPSSTPVVYLGDNTLAGASTTTTSTSTTSTTTTTTAAPASTTTTTSTSTTTTTTTAGPPTLFVDFGRTSSNSSATFGFSVYDSTGEIDVYYSGDHDDYLQESTVTMWTQDSISDISVVKGYGKPIPISTLYDGYMIEATLSGYYEQVQFRLWDVTDAANPVCIGALPEFGSPPDFPQFVYLGGYGGTAGLIDPATLLPGRSYRLEVRAAAP